MLKRFLEKRLKPNVADSSAPADSGNSWLRRGATAMEYLVAISFILVVAILAIQHVGSVTGGLLGNSAKATKFSNSTGS